MWEYLRILTKDNDKDSIDDKDNDDASSGDEVADEPMYAGHHDDLSNALLVGHNFVVNAEEEEEASTFLSALQ